VPVTTADGAGDGGGRPVEEGGWNRERMEERTGRISNVEGRRTSLREEAGGVCCCAID